MMAILWLVILAWVGFALLVSGIVYIEEAAEAVGMGRCEKGVGILILGVVFASLAIVQVAVVHWSEIDTSMVVMFLQSINLLVK